MRQGSYRLSFLKPYCYSGVTCLVIVDIGKDLSSWGQQGDTPAIGADGSVSFDFVDGHYVGILPQCWFHTSRM